VISDMALLVRIVASAPQCGQVSLMVRSSMNSQHCLARR
jgi:hypothetical protein